jgi:hypothetical protein
LGLGEKEDDLQIFDAEKFADAFTQISWLKCLILKAYRSYTYNFL